MITFIDDNRASYRVGPICRLLPLIAPSTNPRARRAATGSDSPVGASAAGYALQARDRSRVPEIFAVYGVRKVRRQMMREGHPIARCTVGRLLREMGLARVIRGKPARTTISDKAAPCPLTALIRG